MSFKCIYTPYTYQFSTKQGLGFSEKAARLSIIFLNDTKKAFSPCLNPNYFICLTSAGMEQYLGLCFHIVSFIWFLSSCTT